MNTIDQYKDAAQASFRILKSQTLEKPDSKAASKQIEALFLNEMMRIMMEQTSLGQDKTISTFLPVITSEVSKSMAERGIGLGEFLMKNAPSALSASSVKDTLDVKEENQQLSVER
jgi:Rod binding domain-containing protein